MTDYNKIYEYIQKEIIPKYSELEFCTMHKLPEEVINTDVEYIFKINSTLNRIDINILKRNILMDLNSIFGNDFNRKFLIIFSEF